MSARRTLTVIFLESLPPFRPQTNQISESAAPQWRDLTRSFRSWGASGRASNCPDPVVRTMFAAGSVLRPQTVGLGGLSRRRSKVASAAMEVGLPRPPEPRRWRACTCPNRGRVEGSVSASSLDQSLNGPKCTICPSEGPTVVRAIQPVPPTSNIGCRSV